MHRATSIKSSSIRFTHHLSSRTRSLQLCVNHGRADGIEIVGVRMMGTSLTKVAEVLRISRDTVSKTITVHSRTGKTTSEKYQRGWKCVLNNRDIRTLRNVLINN